ncbi:hypothetical protein IC220_02625 [Wolbachia endosymbiont of Pentalonia nigronervosa]|uniref:hypothetical protein n=1 Tax=Wolbachia endosymbiont of Pentalonia nigronervosa TaxID=1301914 RepID=UPI00165F320C|nr:hypothetical protein [Wolbachia endosymbiont of Pentalonia nigronervosa]MBD0391353.1 hypothetical protein [Wolbachia endosymbiont of Pentalonia nigronervosa]
MFYDIDFMNADFSESLGMDSFYTGGIFDARIRHDSPPPGGYDESVPGDGMED